MLDDDRQPSGILFVHCFHTRVVTVETQRTVSCQFIPYGLITFCQCHQFPTQFLIWTLHPRSPAAA
ncbi:hypothetical protein B5P43_19670 [Bacillus sp. SRB_336]|nr:hypothetical protein B5P43_19670 [Bacillus sp. SRB_336]